MTIYPSSHASLLRHSLSLAAPLALGLACMGSGQTGDAGFGVGQIGGERDAGATAMSGGGTGSTAGSPSTAGQASADNGGSGSTIPNPTGDCSAEGDGSRMFDHVIEPGDVYLPDCTLTLEREHYRVFAQASGTAYMIPRPDGNPGLTPVCNDEFHTLRDVVDRYQLCESATEETVEIVNAMEPADALAIAHFLHEQLVFFSSNDPTQAESDFSLVTPFAYQSDVLEVCNANPELASGLFESECARLQDAANGGILTDEGVVYTVVQAVALAQALNELYGIRGEDECMRLGNSASRELSAVLEESRSCTQDVDCELIGHGSACHDSCSASVAIASRSGIETAIDQIEVSQCLSFQNAGCNVIAPPCVPPSMATCVEGRCQ